MSYCLINRNYRKLSGFHDGDLSIGRILHCRKDSRIRFNSPDEAEDFIKKIKIRSLKQSAKWGEDRLKKVLKFIDSLTIVHS